MGSRRYSLKTKYSHKYSHGLPFTLLYCPFLLFTTCDTGEGRTFSLYLLQLPLNLTTDQKARGSNPLGRTRERPSETVKSKEQLDADQLLLFFCGPIVVQKSKFACQCLHSSTHERRSPSINESRRASSGSLTNTAAEIRKQSKHITCKPYCRPQKNHVGCPDTYRHEAITGSVISRSRRRAWGSGKPHISPTSVQTNDLHI